MTILGACKATHCTRAERWALARDWIKAMRPAIHYRTTIYPDLTPIWTTFAIRSPE